jgi:hypothetical protein
MDSSRSNSSFIGFNSVDTASVEARSMALTHVEDAMSGRALLTPQASLLKNDALSVVPQK